MIILTFCYFFLHRRVNNFLLDVLREWQVVNIHFFILIFLMIELCSRPIYIEQVVHSWIHAFVNLTNLFLSRSSWRQYSVVIGLLLLQLLSLVMMLLIIIVWRILRSVTLSLILISFFLMSSSLLLMIILIIHMVFSSSTLFSLTIEVLINGLKFSTNCDSILTALRIFINLLKVHLFRHLIGVILHHVHCVCLVWVKWITTYCWGLLMLVYYVTGVTWLHQQVIVLLVTHNRRSIIMLLINLLLLAVLPIHGVIILNWRNSVLIHAHLWAHCHLAL